jgi:hypothetical protein
MDTRVITSSFLIFLAGCADYQQLARTTASADFKCAAEQVQVKDKSSDGKTHYFVAEGCDESGLYACWDTAAANDLEAKPVCQLQHTARGKPLEARTAGESRCQEICSSGWESCLGGCQGNECSAMCGALKDGCIEGCVRAVQAAPAPSL